MSKTITSKLFSKAILTDRERSKKVALRLRMFPSACGGSVGTTGEAPLQSFDAAMCQTTCNVLSARITRDSPEERNRCFPPLRRVSRDDWGGASTIVRRIDVKRLVRPLARITRDSPRRREHHATLACLMFPSACGGSRDDWERCYIV